MNIGVRKAITCNITNETHVSCHCDLSLIVDFSIFWNVAIGLWCNWKFADKGSLFFPEQWKWESDKGECMFTRVILGGKKEKEKCTSKERKRKLQVQKKIGHVWNYQPRVPSPIKTRVTWLLSSASHWILLKIKRVWFSENWYSSMIYKKNSVCNKIKNVWIEWFSKQFREKTDNQKIVWTAEMQVNKGCREETLAWQLKNNINVWIQVGIDFD